MIGPSYRPARARPGSAIAKPNPIEKPVEVAQQFPPQNIVLDAYIRGGKKKVDGLKKVPANFVCEVCTFENDVSRTEGKCAMCETVDEKV